MEFTLQLLHASDQEGAAPALVDAPNMSAVFNALEPQFENTLKLASGDLWLPGLFYNASTEVYGAPGIGDVLINSAIGFEASAFGNHEFDQGTEAIRTLLAANPEIVGPGIGEGGYTGTLFPYLSANLDFSADANLADLVVDNGLEASTVPNGIAQSTVITVNGERIGIVGATTPTLARISSPGPDVAISPADSSDFEALAAIIQTSVDELLAANPDINKVILLAHMQRLNIEVDELAPRLRDVDIIVGGGSDTILANPENRLRDGDEAADVYPIIQTAADGNPIAIVNTDGQYLYVGRLVVTFDAEGIIQVDSIDPAVSGPYPTDAQGVADLGAEGLVDSTVAEVIAALNEVIADKERNLFGITEVFLNARRDGGGLDGVRNQETNLGNLTADANLWYGQQVDPAVQISLKNGGGIRESIGSVTTLAGEVEPVRLPPEAAEIFGKPEGGITQTDIESVLAFNNGLSLVTITATELLEILEHTVSSASPDAPDGSIGSFAHVGGISYSFDATRPARQTDVAGVQTAPGERIRSVALVDEAGNVIDAIVDDGVIQGDPNRTFRTILLDFLADGGSGYPIPQRDRLDLTTEGVIPVNQITVGNFAIRFDPGRVTDTTSGFYVVDTVGGLGLLFDIGPLSAEQISAANGTLSLGTTDLLLAFELVSTLGLPGLERADVGDVRLDAAFTPTSVPNQFTIGTGTTSVFLDRNALRFGAQLDLVGAESTGIPASEDFQVGFPITGATGATVLLDANGNVAGFDGSIDHTGTVTFNQEFASFAPPGSEQDAFAEYLAAFYPPTAESGFNQEDTPREIDERIQNLAFRSDTVLGGDGGETPGNGGETPGNGGETPGDGGETPGNGGETPGNGGETPGNGGETPGNGGETPGNNGLLLDLQDITGDVAISFVVGREAAFDNFVGFYAVTDTSGGIDTDSNGVADLLPGESGYTEAALSSRVDAINLTTPNNVETEFEVQLPGGSLYAPFLVVNGAPEDADSGQVYFAFPAANADGIAHIRLSSGTMGFEDTFGGGDNDFNDLTVSFELVTTV